MAKKPKKEAVTDDRHSTLTTWVREAEDATSDSRALSEKGRDYYDSNQLTAEEIKAQNKRKQAPVVINRVKPKMDALMGIEQANKTTCKAFPRTQKHQEAAESCTEAERFVLQDNSYGKIRAAAWENMIIEGTGGCEVIVEPSKREADGVRITINHIMWDRIIYDPHSRTKSFDPRTCRYLGQVVWMDFDEAAAMYPEAKNILESMQSDSATFDDKPRWMDNTRRRCKIVELYYKQDGEVWYACFTGGGFCKEPMVSPYVNEEGETEWPYEFGSLFVDRDGGRYGATKQLLDVQDEINKRRSKALHLLSVRQTFGTAGAVADTNKARQELAKPDGHLEVAFGEFGKDFGVLPTGDMAAAQFNLLTEAKMEIDSVGANAATQGKDKTVQSGIALQRREQAGQTEIGPMLAVLKDMDYRVYRKVWNCIRKYWKAERWIRVTDDENNLRWVGLNAPVTKGQMMLEEAQKAGVPPEQLQAMQQQIAQDPLMQEVVSTKNQIAELDVDLILTDVPDVITSQIEDFQVLGEMVKSGFPMPPIAVIEASPLIHKDKIIKMMKEQPQVPPQMQKQLEQQQEQMQKLAEENQQLKAGAQDTVIKTQSREKEKMAELDLQERVQARELQLQEERNNKEIQLKRDVANAEYEIEQRKMTMQQDTESKKMAFERQKAQGDIDVQAEAAGVPQVVQALGQLGEMFNGIMEALQRQTAATEAQTQIQQQSLSVSELILKNQLAPKKVSIGGVQKTSDGRIVGADISTSIQQPATLQ